MNTHTQEQLRVYEPSSLPPDDHDTVPNMEIVPGLRIHLHIGGVSFALVDPHDERFAVLVPYAKAREIMLQVARNQAQEDDWDEDQEVQHRLSMKGV